MQSKLIHIGLDVGSVSVKLAAWIPRERAKDFEVSSDGSVRFSIHREAIPSAPGYEDYVLLLSEYSRHMGEPVGKASEILSALRGFLDSSDGTQFQTTGSGGKEAARNFGFRYVNEYRAIAEGMGLLYPEVRTVLEMGGGNSKYIRLKRNTDGSVAIEDYETNGECAAGTGLFFDQQVERLEIRIEDAGGLVRNASRSASIAGRCSVFAKSDMIHAQQRGFTPPEILKGLCESVVRNFKGSILKGRDVVPMAALIGGVSFNDGVADAFRSIFGLQDGGLIVPELGPWTGAIGAAVIGIRESGFGNRGTGENKLRVTGYEGMMGEIGISNSENQGFNSRLQTRNSEPEIQNPDLAQANLEPGTLNLERFSSNSKLETRNLKPVFPHTRPLSMDKVVLLRDRIESVRLPADRKIPAFLGIDIGSVSTNLALITEEGGLIHGIYTMTRGRPIEVVGECLKEMESHAGRVDLRGVGTTGSGRDLIGMLVGADVVKDEITAHKTGAVHVAKTFLDRDVDTIFEVGGQDSKFISMRRGAVVDFCLNEACAAGTGSFLEEQARQIGVEIRGEFATLALKSANPLKLGERCTVFMARELGPYLQKGVPKEDLVAGLALSVALNYLNRVVKKRVIGDTVFFQGGTAYNDAVAAAFATLLDREIIVPPHNGIMGAIGAAMLARDRADSRGNSRFRGWHIEKVPRSLREFTCNACPNRCVIQEFTVAGEKSHWGDKCSDRYRKRTRTDRKAVIPNLVRFREDLMEPLRTDSPPPASPRGTAGVPLALFFHDRLPFWRTYLRSLGFGCAFSGTTNHDVAAAGVEACVNEPCFPVQAAHGHFVRLMEEKPDFIFFPNTVNEEDPLRSVASFLCPWVQTLPLVAKHVQALRPVREKIVCPRVQFRDGEEAVERQLFRQMSGWNISSREHRSAVRKAFEAQEAFRSAMLEQGAAALKILSDSEAPAVVLVGRPYNLHDPGMNLNIPLKLAEIYGANAIPMDFLPIDGIDVRPVNDHMFWNYGRRILQAARFVRDFPKFQICYLSNFKCGPDSYIRHYVEEAAGKPFLFLQLDSHSNDAGVMTRIEAFLESKGML